MAAGLRCPIATPGIAPRCLAGLRAAASSPFACTSRAAPLLLTVMSRAMPSPERQNPWAGSELWCLGSHPSKIPAWLDAAQMHLSLTGGTRPGSKRPGYKGSSSLPRTATLPRAKPYCHRTGCWHRRPGSAPLSYSLGGRRDARRGVEQQKQHPKGSQPRKGQPARPRETSAAPMTETLPAAGALLWPHGGEPTLSPTTPRLAAARTRGSSRSQVLGAANSRLLSTNLPSSHPGQFFKRY